MSQQKSGHVDKNYISEIDYKLAEFNKTHVKSQSQREEIERHRRVFERRDHAQAQGRRSILGRNPLPSASAEISQRSSTSNTSSAKTGSTQPFTVITERSETKTVDVTKDIGVTEAVGMTEELSTFEIEQFARTMGLNTNPETPEEKALFDEES